MRAPVDPALAGSNRFFRTLRAVGRCLFSLLFSIRAEGLERLPTEGGYLLVCNHLSWFDPLALLATLPPEPRIHFMAAAEYTVRGPAAVQWIVRNAGGIIPVERETHRGDRAAVVQALRVLRGGGVLGIFPEGRCGPAEGQVQPLKEGAASFAVKTKRPILVAGISGTQELFWRKRICLRIGPLLTPHPDEEPERLLQRLEAAMAATIPPLRPDQPRRKWLSWLNRLF